jgi:hypothetical protein
MASLRGCPTGLINQPCPESHARRHGLRYEQRGLVRHCLRDAALAGAGLANDERVAALGDELQRMQLEARLAV